MKINIIRQDALKVRRAQRIKRINALVTVGSIVLFFLSVLWTSGQFVYLAIRNTQLSGTLKTLNTLYTTRGKEEVDYLAVKQIVDTVDQIQAKRFGYKEFLNGIYKLLPSNAKLSGVDFTTGRVILVTVRLSSIADYDILLSNIKNQSTDGAFLFSQIAQDSFQRDKSGAYLVILELKIK